jgi:hypothetical protein
MVLYTLQNNGRETKAADLLAMTLDEEKQMLY